MYPNPKVYNSSRYVKDLSAFDNYQVVGSALLDKTKEEMQEMLGEPVEQTTPASTVQQF